uniref:Glycosyltransferase n=1 Tax=Leersia perrieri TaxID=77586 RepID=A0A0D9WYX5_9ORYZ
MAAAAAVHVLVFPTPVQGHINCMMHFAAGLVDAGLHVTFLHSDHNLRRLGGAATAGSPRLRFLSVPDDHARGVGDLLELLRSFQTKGSVAYRSLLTSLVRAGDNSNDGFPPVTCVVADGILSFAIDAAEEIGVPAIAFRTGSACSILSYFSLPRMFQLGDLPFPAGGGGGDLDEPVRGVPGMESFLRRRDLPSQFRSCTENQIDPMLQYLIDVTAHSSSVRALVLNTAASMEASAVAHIAKRMRDVFAIGPLQDMFPAPAGAASLWRADDACMAWLDGKTDRSVVYVSLGSLTVISREQFTEFLSGLIATGYPFLWVLRPNMVEASKNASVQEAIEEARNCNGRVVEWAPQRDVLRHRAVGCFLTHAGWNSTVEATIEGVPMMCWPFFADQQMNSRFVGAVWKTGLDMKDVCDRAVVAKMVREAMESAEIRESARTLARMVRQDVADGGSSAAEFKRLVGFIKELSTTNK